MHLAARGLEKVAMLAATGILLLVKDAFAAKAGLWGYHVVNLYLPASFALNARNVCRDTTMKH